MCLCVCVCGCNYTWENGIKSRSTIQLLPISACRVMLNSYSGYLWGVLTGDKSVVSSAAKASWVVIYVRMYTMNNHTYNGMESDLQSTVSKLFRRN